MNPDAIIATGKIKDLGDSKASLPMYLLEQAKRIIQQRVAKKNSITDTI